MKYYLSYNLIYNLIFAETENKKKIVEILSGFLKGDTRFFTSVYAIDRIFSSEKINEFSKIFLKQIEILCDRIYPLQFEDYALGERLFEEYKTDKEILLEFSVCIQNNIDIFLTTGKINFEQKLLSIERITLKSE